MKLMFVQSDTEQRIADQVILNGLSLKKAKVGTWILPPAHSKDGKFTVIDSPTGKDVYVHRGCRCHGGVGRLLHGVVLRAVSCRGE